MSLFQSRWIGSFGVVPFLQIFLQLSGLQSFAEVPSVAVPLAKILSIEGASFLTVQASEISRKVKAGSPLGVGDKIATLEQTAAVIEYVDGSTVTVGPNSEFQLEDQIDGTQWNRLRKGNVRGLITKPPIPISKAKFLIRTRAAILGVRGTDFVMALDPVTNAAQVHTLEGSVEVALNEEVLLRGGGTVVGDGKFIDARSGKIEFPESFNKEEFLKSYDSAMPSANGMKGIGQDGPAQGKLTARVTSSVNPLSGETWTGSEALGPGFSEPRPPSGEEVEPPLKLLPPLSEKLNNEDKPPGVEKPKVLEEPSRFRLLSFRLGAFFSVLPDGTLIRAAHAAWSPTLPVPGISFLTIRGNLGFSFARDGTLASGLLIKEYQVFLNLRLLNLLFVEAGIGEQIWRPGFNLEGQLRSVGAGLLLPSDMLKCIYVSYQYLEGVTHFNQFKAGIEISL
jgi:hypothetical protein